MRRRSLERLLRERRSLIPLGGITLSLGILLVLPILVGRHGAELRDTILQTRVPLTLASEKFRIAVADEATATQAYLATGDAIAADRLALASAERRLALETLRTSALPADTVLQDRLTALVAAAEALPDWPAGSSLAPSAGLVAIPDTSALRAAWTEVTAATDRLRRAIDSGIATDISEIQETERLGVQLTAFLTALALISALVTYRMEKRARAFARASERARREQQVLLQSSGEGILGLDRHGRCTFLNPAAAELIGYSEGEVLGRDLRQLLLTGDHRANDGYPKSRSFAGGPIRTTEETTLARKDGVSVEVECLTSPIVARHGGVHGAVLTLRDISGRKAVERARSALLEKEHSLRVRAEAAERRARFLAAASELFGSSLDLDTTLDSLSKLIVPKIADSSVIYLVDESGCIQRLEPAHVDAASRQVLKEQLDRYPARIESLIPPVRLALTEGTPALVRTVRVDEMKAVPGDLRHESVIEAVGLKSLIVVPLRARGRIIGAISYGASETARAFGPEDLTLAEDLATRAGLAIDNARLYQESQEAVRARNEVLGVVSHDLRNPLNAVRFGAQSLIRHWPPSDDGEIERKQLVSITRAADRMHRLIRDLLDVAQIDAGRLAIEPRPVNAASLLDDAVELASPLAIERGVRLSSGSVVGSDFVRADPERVLQVLSNLISNAIKFSKPGSEVTIGAERDGRDVVLRVLDRGKGIAPDEIAHVFDRFWRARDGSREGAGLGLAIARGIVESHGGRIWVESVLGEGSTFYFTLPAADTTGGHVPIALYGT